MCVCARAHTHIELTDTIKKLKEQLHGKLQVVVDNQYLVFATQQLNDKLISDYDIKNGSTTDSCGYILYYIHACISIM